MKGFIFKHKFLVAFFALVLALPLIYGTLHSAQAGENVTTLNSGSITYSTSEYHRDGTTIQLSGQPSIGDINACAQAGVTCRNLVPATASATVNCAGLPGFASGGGWNPGSPSGQCWTNLDACFYASTRNEICVQPSGDVSQPNMFSITHTSNCSPNSKGACIINYDSSPAISGDTGDDMFKLPKNSSAFFEYQSIGGINDADRLRYITRSGGGLNKDLMVPSGPFTGGSAYDDYRGFLTRHPSFVTVDPACYPVSVRMCAGGNVSAPAQNGSCGSANGGYTLAAPSDGGSQTSTVLCARGNPTAVTGSGPWYWTCNGLDGGNPASCESDKLIVGACGGADGSNYPTAPTGGLCADGTATAVNGSGASAGYWKWTCVGNPSPTYDASCTANLQRNGVCGTSNGVSSTSAPSTGLCEIGSASAVSNGGTNWEWTCAGEYGGTTASCSAPIDNVYGTCGNADGGYYASASGVNSNGLCTEGTPSPASVSGSGPWSWTCLGDGPAGTDDNCSANEAVSSTCGPANGAQFDDTNALYAAELCATADSATEVSGSGPWQWGCMGSDGNVNQYCDAYPTCRPGPTSDVTNGTCGSAHGNTYANAGSVPGGSARCLTGSASGVSQSGSTLSWTCAGVNGGLQATCTATVTQCGGSTPRDIVLVVDDSGSIGTSNFNTMKNFIKAFASNVSLASNERIGLVKFSTNLNATINLTNSVSSFRSSVDGLSYTGLGTRIDKGLIGGANLLVSRNNNGNSKTLILLTDGYSGGDPVGAATTVKDGGYRILSVGIGNLSLDQLNQIRSTNSSVYNVDFGNLGTIINALKQDSCNGAGNGHTYSTGTVTEDATTGGSGGGGGSGGCFAADTMISMADGTEKAIQDIAVGDMVASFDKGQSNADLTTGRVTHVYNLDPKQTYDFNGTLVTGAHTFMTASGEMIAFEDMTDDTEIMLDNLSVVKRGPLVEGPVVPVYNFTVDGTHSYIANGMRVGNMTLYPSPAEGVYSEQDIIGMDAVIEKMRMQEELSSY